MTTVKKNSSTKKGTSKAIIDTKLYDKLNAREKAILNKVNVKSVINTKDVLLASQISLNKVYAKLIKAMSKEQLVNIPSKDYVDQFIDKEKLKIDTLLIDKKHNHLFFILNNGFTIQEKISKCPLLKGVSEQKLKKFKLYAWGTCIEWEELDEDLSLRGILKDTVFNPLLKTLKNNKGFVLAAE